MAQPLSVTLITLNEERNIARALESVRWADDLVVVDSGSQDRTVEIAKKMGARVFHQPWKGYGQQKNIAQDHALHDWVLNLDADEAVPPELAQEIQALLAGKPRYDAYELPRLSTYLGRQIFHGGWYPNHLVRLGRRSQGRWTEPAVHEAWTFKGGVGRLQSPLHHFPFRDIHDQVETNLRFSRLGSEELRKRGFRVSLGKLLWKHIGKFIETYFLKRGFRDGMAGFIISVNAAHSMFLKIALFYDPSFTKELPKNTDAHSDRR